MTKARKIALLALLVAAGCGDKSPAQKANSNLQQANVGLQKALCNLDKATVLQIQIDLYNGTHNMTVNDLAKAESHVERDCK